MDTPICIEYFDFLITALFKPLMIVNVMTKNQTAIYFLSIVNRNDAHYDVAY